MSGSLQEYSGDTQQRKFILLFLVVELPVHSAAGSMTCSTICRAVHKQLNCQELQDEVSLLCVTRIFL